MNIDLLAPPAVAGMDWRSMNEHPPARGWYQVDHPHWRRYHRGKALYGRWDGERWSISYSLITSNHAIDGVTERAKFNPGLFSAWCTVRAPWEGLPNPGTPHDSGPSFRSAQ
jgi:hypothetical protein